MALVLLIVGVVVMIVGGVMVLIAAFRESVLWGLGCLFFWPVNLIFIVTHWQESKTGFLIQLAGGALMVVGILIGGATGPAVA